MTHSFGWVRCASSGGNCSPISGATAATYAAASADAGSTIRVTVTASNSAGSATATSAATAVFTGAPAVQLPSGLGTSLPARMPGSSGSSALYVSTTGSDSNAGTIASPFKTLNKAFSVASDGTIIDLRGGNYDVQVVSNRRFSPSNPVTVQSYPGERAVFIGQTAYTNAATFTNVQGIRLRDLTFDAPTNTNLKFVSVQHVEVDHVISKNSGRSCDPTVPSCGGTGILVVGESGAGFAFSYTDDIQIWNSQILNNGGTKLASMSHDHGIYMCSSGASYGTATEAGCKSFVIANNTIYNGPTGYGIQLGDAARNGIITNNTIDNTYHGTNYTGCGIIVWSAGTWGTSNDLIVNNIFSNNAANAVCASVGKNPTGNVVRNNLSFNNYLTCDWCSTKDYEPVYGSYSGFTLGTNVPAADPQYVNRTANDFHLRATSPALEKSDPAYTPPLDADGVPRPSFPALGAFG
jgi:hypothetical protein